MTFFHEKSLNSNFFFVFIGQQYTGGQFTTLWGIQRKKNVLFHSWMDSVISGFHCEENSRNSPFHCYLRTGLFYPSMHKTCHFFNDKNSYNNYCCGAIFNFLWNSFWLSILRWAFILDIATFCNPQSTLRIKLKIHSKNKILNLIQIGCVN